MTKYEDINALNFSTLKHIAVSPAYLRYVMDNPEEKGDTDAYRRGRAIHCATLEPERFERDFIVVPDFDQMARDKYGSLRTKEAQQSRDTARAEWESSANPEAEQITEENRETALRCASAVLSHPKACDLLSGARFEQAVQWIHPETGIHCKGRLDIVTDRIVDLKSTRHNTMREVARAAAQYDYHVQCAWYHDGAKTAGLIDGNKHPAMIVVHATPGSKFVDVAVLDMDLNPFTLDAGRRTYEKWINLYAGCLSANLWPGMCSGSEEWTVPQWKLEGVDND